jgi:secreted trypsin-like serine protease
MKIIQSSIILWLSVIILLCIDRTKPQTYTCSSSASCGCSTNSATLTRIVGGESASAATWGWAVSLYITGGYLCGGSIISSSWIITAAHCVNGLQGSDVTVYAGSLSRWTGTQIITGSSVTVHPSYNTTTYVYDIALVKLSSPLSMSDPYVSQICLPSISSATLAAGEWPPVGTSVSNSFPFLTYFHMYYYTSE